VPESPPTCERCGLPPIIGGCIPRPGAVRFGMERPGEPGGVVAMALTCPTCYVGRGDYHHAGCRFERRHAG
jgi:hypothetical protein